MTNMDVNTIFSSILTYIVQFIFFIPIQILRLIGTFLPSCDSLGIVVLGNNISNGMVQWIRFAWPVLKFLPWDVIWGLFSAELLLLAFLWFWDHIGFIAAFVAKWWVVIVILFILLPAVNFFLGTAWQNNPAFTDVFDCTPGTSSTDCGFSGGGFGGGGGGGW